MHTLLRVICVAVLLTGCASPRGTDTASALVAKIRNDDIRWDGNYIGLQAVAGGVTQEILSQHTDKLIPALMTALEDENRYIAAHVLLCKLTGLDDQTDSRCWNGLHVEIRSDGRAVIPAGEQQAMIQRWKAWRERN